MSNVMTVAARPRITRTSLLFLVPFLGLLWDAVAHVYSFVVYNSSSPTFAVFIVVPLAGALAVFRGGRIGYAVSLIISLQFFLVEGPFGGLAAGAWSSVTVTDYFAIFMITAPALFLALLYSAAGLIKLLRPRGVPPRLARFIPPQSLLVLVAVGFVIGGLTIGMMAATTELRLSQHQPAVKPDVFVLQGASASNSGLSYSPATYTVVVGTTVTWLNNDTATHSITENNGLFDSGPLPPGASFSYTFTQPGIYHYSCLYHPWMAGIIVVTSE
jgi:plastocyanin